MIKYILLGDLLQGPTAPERMPPFINTISFQASYLKNSSHTQWAGEENYRLAEILI